MRTIATVGGIGFLPRIPGTAASVVGLGLIWVLSGSPLRQVLGCIAALGLALWSAGPTARAMGHKDPSAVVIDEVAGMMVGLAALPATWGVYLGGFALFRFLDIVKPGPIRRAQRLPGSWGIVADDLLAGLVTNALLRFILLAQSVVIPSTPLILSLVEG